MQTDSSALDKATQMIERVREVMPRMEMQTLLMLFVIGRRPRITKPELERALGMPPASGHRNLALLRNEGMVDVVSSYQGSEVFLTKGGQNFVAHLTAPLEGLR